MSLRKRQLTPNQLYTRHRWSLSWSQAMFQDLLALINGHVMNRNELKYLFATLTFVSGFISLVRVK